MANQSKNRVKLNQRYRKIGTIPLAALKRVNDHFEAPFDAKTIRANKVNTIKHNNDHLSYVDKALDELGITKEGYAEYVARNYTEIWKGKEKKSLVLVVRVNDKNHMAAVHLFLDKNENFWLVKSVHIERDADLNRMTLIWFRGM